MSHYKILLVDDDELDRAYYKQMLINDPAFSCEVFEAANATIALEICEKESIDCILVEYLLPGINGIEFINLLKKKHGQSIPIVMVTGQGDETVAVAAMKAGIADYIIKNQVNPHNLVKTVLDTLQKNNITSKTTPESESLKEYAYYDDLTGMLNRHAFADSAIRAISDAKRHQRAIAILNIDLDYFKQINDEFGHSVGDEILKTIAQRMNQVLRKEDIVARLGEDEFAVLLTGLNCIDDVDIVTNKLLQAIHQPLQLNNRVISINASIGIACYPEGGENFTNLLQNADIALYKAKSSGRGIFQYYTEEIKNIHQKRLFMEHALQNAVSNHELKLVYQPIYELKTKKLKGVEALLRWQHPQLGIITPEKFIPLAEETGMIIDIDDWVIHTTCYQLEEWLKLFYQNMLRMSVNVSYQEISNPNFFWTLSRLIKDMKIPPNCIELEIKESTLMKLDPSTPIFKELDDLGVRLTVDDFGREYSSYQKLKKLPLTSLKIDSTFIRDIARGKAEAAVVKSILNIAKDLDLEVIAEGIETEYQLAFLIEQGCLYGQGFYFSKPLQPEQMTEFLIHPQRFFTH